MTTSPPGIINFDSSLFLFEDVARVIQHPVHLVDKDGKASPSAFIPFCDFGGRTSEVATEEQIEGHKFDVPICTCFKDKILKDQHCYEVDLNNFSRHDNRENELKLGFAFMIAYNEDRQHILYKERKLEDEWKEKGLINKTLHYDDTHAHIYLNTIGNQVDSVSRNICIMLHDFFCRACKLCCTRRVQSKWIERNRSYRFISWLRPGR